MSFPVLVTVFTVCVHSYMLYFDDNPVWCMNFWDVRIPV